MVFLLAFGRIYDGDWDNKLLRETTTQEVTIVETVHVDDPLGSFVAVMLDETLGGLGGLDSLLHTRALTSWAASSKQAVMLHIKIKFNILDDWS